MPEAPVPEAPRVAVRQAVAAAHRDHWTGVVAATAASVRDLDVAEESAQEAFAKALTGWERDGIPRNPAAWLTTAARRRALDSMRRRRTLESKLPLLVWPDAESVPSGSDHRLADEHHADVVDDQLRLIFLCCHEALAPEARVALTLRLVSGVATDDIAAAFLVSPSTMAARLTRAKRRITLSRMPCRVPTAQELPSRLTDVLDVVSVLLATGHAAPSGATVQREAVLDATVHLLELLGSLLPKETEVAGLLAQALLVQARTETRTDTAGHPIPLVEQDRRRWDRGLVDRADALVVAGLSSGGRGPYLIHAAIAAARCVPQRVEDVDHAEILELYNYLLRQWPTAMVRLNRAVALAEVRGPREALAEADRVADELDGYRFLHVVRADLLARLGRRREAIEAYRRAIRRGGSDGERELLRMHIDQLD